MLLEQNAVPGLTNRLLAPIVRAVAVTYESTGALFGAKAIVSGNPVRPEFSSAGASGAAGGEAPDRRGVRLLVFGGSQGAHAINVAMAEAAPQLSGDLVERIVHQTGEADLDTVRQAYERAGLVAEVEPYLYDMAARLRASDLVVCRAGATTLAELTAVGRPAILVPLPTATDDHQRNNAEALAAGGAAEVLLQADATGQRLADRIRALAAHPERRKHMAVAARGLARVDAARIIVDRALALVT
jgi:UDP-N-acetylglucosamine--N-acetylmuramyl-(pentapeptide) pyrophosphoryl-undecaprenol N-acetylglucosamine transferase